MSRLCGLNLCRRAVFNLAEIKCIWYYLIYKFRKNSVPMHDKVCHSGPIEQQIFLPLKKWMGLKKFLREVCSSLEWYNYFFLLLVVLHINHTWISALTRCSAGVGSSPQYHICMLHALIFWLVFTAVKLHLIYGGWEKAKQAQHTQLTKGFIITCQCFLRV